MGVTREPEKMKNKIIFFVLVGVIIFNVGNVIWTLRGKYFSHDYWQRFPSLKKVYYSSIYANKNGAWIPDETIYSYNGGALITGENPILVSPEVPPVGKYLIGLSAFFFNNENIIIPFSAISSLVLLFLIGRQIFSSSLLALLPPFFLSFEPIFKNQLTYTPLLDIIHLMFLLLSFYFFNRAFNNKKNIFTFFLFTSLSFGLFISTKFFGIGITVILAFFAVLILNKDTTRLLFISLTLPLSILVLLVSYIRVLVIGYPFNRFLGIQKWVFWYNQGHIHMSFTVWPLLLLNKWYVLWDNKILSDPQWKITWPIITILSLVTIGLYCLKKIPKNRGVEVLIAWVVFYLIFLSLGDASARYFVILIPVMYLTAIFGVFSVLKIIVGKRK